MDVCDILLRTRTNSLVGGMAKPTHETLTRLEVEETRLAPKRRVEVFDMVPTPRLHPLQTDGQTRLEGIMKGSPKRKRRGSDEEDVVRSDLRVQGELEKARGFKEINSHFRGERFGGSSVVVGTPEILGMDGEGVRLEGGDEVNEEGQSPRTVVAKRLGLLEVRDFEVPGLSFRFVGGEDAGGEEKERKKARLEGFEDVSSTTTTHTERDGFSPGTVGGPGWLSSLSFRDKTDSGDMVEIPETPQPPAPSSHSKRPPPPSSTSPLTLKFDTTSRSSTTHEPSSSANDILPNSDLTWHDSEITGHLALDPDDDGYGVNGIGFRPTPAMAYARSQRRRQQILEWKNRESREARSRRAEERRRGMKIGGGGAEGEKGRAVRFVE